MPIHSPSKSDLENARKFPWQWTVFMLCGTIAIVFGLLNLRINKSDATCEERISKYSMALAKRDSAVFYWQSKYISLSNELLYKNHIIDRQQNVIAKTDSVARDKLEQTAKQIVKNHDQ